MASAKGCALLCFPLCLQVPLASQAIQASQARRGRTVRTRLTFPAISARTLWFTNSHYAAFEGGRAFVQPCRHADRDGLLLRYLPPTAGKPGPAGEVGTAGKNGAAGAAGTDGKDGAPGARGKDGSDGSSGLPGPQGAFPPPPPPPPPPIPPFLSPFLR